MTKVKLDQRKALEKIEKSKDQILDAWEANAQNIITKQISAGISPVQGEGKFQKYSDSYREAIQSGRYDRKNVSPVNLKLSGTMLGTFFTVPGDNSIIVGFDSELADIHTNQGAGKSKTIRKMLPQGNEKFNTNVLRQFREVAIAAVRKILNK